MSSNIQKYGVLAIRVLLTLAFGAAGIAKLMGADMMVHTFDQLGFGQWFRYVTGIIEISGAALLWVGGRQVFGAGLLLCTMLGAIAAHLLVLGPSAVPALVLGGLSAVVAYSYRTQISG